MKKTMFIIVMLILASSYSFADDNIKVGNVATPDKTLQENAMDPGDGYMFNVGDTIVISKKTEHYLTGEEPSKWVYYVRHIIGQVGGKRFPNGILVAGIISWIGPEDALLVGATQKTPQSEARIRRDESQVRERQQDLYRKPVQEQRAIADSVSAIGAEPLPILPKEEEAVKEEPVVVEKEEPSVVKEEVVVVEEPVQEEIVEETEQVAQADTTGKRAQVDRFTIGVRGGVASLMQNTSNDMSKRMGFDALLDLQYAHYWQNKNEHLFGLLVGLSVGYAQSGLKDGINEQYTLTSPENELINYTVKSDKVSETNRQIQLEIPLMFSMILKNGFFLNVGPRIMLPVYTPYTEKFSHTDIIADFTDFGVTVPNELATGKLLDDKYTGKSDNKMKLNILLGIELGYEWTFNNGNSLGLGAYADYGWSTYSHDTKNVRLIDISALQSPASVGVNSASDSFTKKMGYFDAGVKVAYHFNWWKNKKQ